MIIMVLIRIVLGWNGGEVGEREHHGQMLHVMPQIIILMPFVKQIVQNSL